MLQALATERHCGECQLCCRLLPVSPLFKPAGVKCSHQRHSRGCDLYGDRYRRPPLCASWGCLWLVGGFPGRRPDRSGFFIDGSRHFVALGADPTCKSLVPAIQVWVDPKRPQAYFAQELKDWLFDLGEMVAVVRCGRKVVTIVPPKMSESGDWLFLESQEMSPQRTQILKRQIFEEALKKEKEDERTGNLSSDHAP